jgi:hypothetical protein
MLRQLASESIHSAIETDQTISPETAGKVKSPQFHYFLIFALELQEFTINMRGIPSEPERK